MMPAIGDVLGQLRGEQHKGVRLYAGASQCEVVDALRPYSTFVPDELMQLYTASNGLTIGDFRIVPLKEIMWPALDCAALHYWGNGDQDAARIAHGQHTCELIFLGHDPAWEFVVAKSLAQWIGAVYAEWSRFETVLDPLSCQTSRVDRLYSKPG